MKKIFLILISTILIVPQFSYAADPEEDVWTLTDEVWDGAGISRTYINEDEKQYYLFLPVPEKSIKTISSSDNSLLEAKKVLALAYVQHDFNERLSELMNDYILPYNANPGISDEIKKSFNEDENEIYSYIDKNIEEPIKFALDEKTFGNFSDRIPNFDEINEVSFKSVKDYVDNFNPHTFDDGKHEISNNFLYFGIILLIMIGFLVLYIKKSRR